MSGPPNQVVTEHPLHGNEFFDLRHHRQEPTLKKYTDQIIKILDDDNFYVYKENGVDVLDTNFMRWKKSDFNNYEENFWFPHQDEGWVCIIYLNEAETNGTNIYEDKHKSIYKYGGRKTEEDRHPWKPKSDFEVVDYLEQNLIGDFYSMQKKFHMVRMLMMKHTFIQKLNKTIVGIDLIKHYSFSQGKKHETKLATLS